MVSKDTVSKDTVSAMVKLARVIDASASDGSVNGMVSHPMTSSTAVRSVVGKDTESAIVCSVGD